MYSEQPLVAREVSWSDRRGIEFRERGRIAASPRGVPFTTSHSEPHGVAGTLSALGAARGGLRYTSPTNNASPTAPKPVGALPLPERIREFQWKRYVDESPFDSACRKNAIRLYDLVRSRPGVRWGRDADGGIGISVPERLGAGKMKFVTMTADDEGNAWASFHGIEHDDFDVIPLESNDDQLAAQIETFLCQTPLTTY